MAAGVWVGVGARDEPDELSGVSHFLEHLLFKGTEERSARDIAAAVDRVGGDINAFTAKEYTAYYCRVPAEQLPLAVELLGDVLTAPALRDGDVDNERQVILEELAMDDDLPEDVAHRLLAEALFPDHPLGRETAGTAESVEAITPDDVRDVLPPLVPAVGDGRGGRRRRSTTTTSWPRWSSASRPRSPRRRPARVRARTSNRVPSWSTAGAASRPRSPWASGGWPALDADREALDVMNHVLGGGLSSRLFEEIREQRGLAYAVGSGTSSYADAGALDDRRRHRAGPGPRGAPPHRRRAGQAARRTASPPTSSTWPSAT